MAAGPVRAVGYHLLEEGTQAQLVQSMCGSWEELKWWQAIRRAMILAYLHAYNPRGITLQGSQSSSFINCSI